MTISVVLTTYNGETYIREQLDTIRNQTVKADEVIISDDCSTDNTINVIKEYIEKFQLNNWHLILREKNVGWKINFHDAILSCSGDLIFLSDQDDIWFKEKIEIMANHCKNKPDILLLASSYKLLYEQGAKMVNSVDNVCSEKDSLKHRQFNYRFLWVDRPGCVYCFRRELIEKSKKYWFETLAHDAWLWRSALLLNGLYVIDKPLIEFRRHNTNATKIKRTIRESMAMAERNNKYCRLLLDSSDELSSLQVNTIKSIIEWNNMRIELFEDKKIFNLLRLFKYRKYYYSFKSYLFDYIFYFQNLFHINI